MSIKVDDLAKIVGKELDIYNEQVTLTTKRVIKDEIEKGLDKVKRKSPRSNQANRKHYADSWEIKNAYEDQYSIRLVIRNKQYQLTHLLEKGHALVNGGRTKAQPHVEPTQNEVNEKVMERLKKEL